MKIIIKIPLVELLEKKMKLFSVVSLKIQLSFIIVGCFGVSPVVCYADEFLDAVVEFAQPGGSHFAGKSHGNALGPPDNQTINIDVPEVLTVAFMDNMVVDGPGNDLQIVEFANGDSSVDVYGSADGLNFEFLISTSGSESIDLSSFNLKTLRFLRFVGLGNGGTTPGYDLDAVVALNSVAIEYDCPTNFHVDTIIRFEQPIGSHDDGNPASAVFNSPDSISQSIDTPEVLEVGFSTIRVVDGPGPDFYVYEHINTDSLVNIFGSADGVNYELLKVTYRSVAVDLADFPLDTVRTFRIEGLEDGGNTPGYDLDAIVAINFECVDITKGDVNLDGNVDLLDVAPFVFQLTNSLYSLQADINGDGDLDLLDVFPFVELLSGG